MRAGHSRTGEGMATRLARPWPVGLWKNPASKGVMVRSPVRRRTRFALHPFPGPLVGGQVSCGAVCCPLGPSKWRLSVSRRQQPGRNDCIPCARTSIFTVRARLLLNSGTSVSRGSFVVGRWAFMRRPSALSGGGALPCGAGWTCRRYIPAARRVVSWALHRWAGAFLRDGRGHALRAQGGREIGYEASLDKRASRVALVLVVPARRRRGCAAAMSSTKRRQRPPSEQRSWTRGPGPLWLG